VLIFWIGGSTLLGGFAFYLNWKLGAVWSVFAVLGFVAIEKMLIGRVDPAGPRSFFQIASAFYALRATAGYQPR